MPTGAAAQGKEPASAGTAVSISSEDDDDVEAVDDEDLNIDVNVCADCIFEKGTDGARMFPGTLQYICCECFNDLCEAHVMRCAGFNRMGLGCARNLCEECADETRCTHGAFCHDCRCTVCMQ